MNEFPTNKCAVCDKTIPSGQIMCEDCTDNEIEASKMIIQRDNPSTSIFTKPANPVEGKDPSVKQAVELEQQTYQLNEEFAREHPERVNPNIAGTKSGKQVIREAESEKNAN